jgi:hypothetical protein
MFMNEENGLRGGVKYADLAKQNNEKHIAAVESDNGGFTPKGFGIVGKAEQKAKIAEWKGLLAPYSLHEIGPGGGGADIGPLAQSGRARCFLAINLIHNGILIITTPPTTTLRTSTNAS